HADRGTAYAMPWLLATDARLLRREGSLDVAIERLREAIALTERGAEGLSAPFDRDQVYGTAAALHRDLADAYFAAGRAGDAFELVEQQRSRVLLAAVAAPPRPRAIRSLAQVATKIPHGTAVLHYTVTGGRIWLFTIRDGTSSLHLLHARAGAVETEIEQLCVAQENGDAARADALSRKLQASLIEPVTGEIAHATRLVFVLDDALARVPLAALRNDNFLVERAEIVVAPSANVYAARVETPAHRGTGAVIVSDPAFDVERYATLSRLPGAANEGRAIAPMYTPVATFAGNDATVAEVLPALSSAAVIHLGLHAVVNERDPGRSALLLAAGPAAGELYLHQIAATDLRRVNLVVAAGCRTATKGRRGMAASSMTTAFLLAGARSVVGALWDIDDHAARAFAILLHRRIAAGMTPATAVRQTQLEMLHHPDPRLRTPAAWAALQLYGS
ncbi:MAG TPA: CHAT domain-containing protein, partial [Thermoanaerobaculia bacterium]|nr:CHAT domain-containing protein [Thermoanaerobaculia bacterium]